MTERGTPRRGCRRSSNRATSSSPRSVLQLPRSPTNLTWRRSSRTRAEEAAHVVELRRRRTRAGRRPPRRRGPGHRRRRGRTRPRESGAAPRAHPADRRAVHAQNPRRVRVGGCDDPSVSRLRTRRGSCGDGVAEGGELEVLDVESGCTSAERDVTAYAVPGLARSPPGAPLSASSSRSRPPDRHVDADHRHQDSRPLFSSASDSTIEWPSSSTSGIASRSALRP